MIKKSIFLVFILISSGHAQIIEQKYFVDVPVKDRFNHAASQKVVVTVLRDGSRNNSPYAILSHGRNADPVKREKMERQRFIMISEWLIQQGFAVIVPTRIGYGELGGLDIEDTGGCNWKDKERSSPDYSSSFKSAVDETAQVLKNLHKIVNYIDFDRGIAIGTSYGGALSVGLASSDLPGLKGSFNFSGGAGGNPELSAQSPCRPDLIGKLYAHWGSNSKVPSYWFYSTNDQYWGVQVPREWFAAYTKAGGRGKYYELPPYLDDGHQSIRNIREWGPVVKPVLHSLGFN